MDPRFGFSAGHAVAVATMFQEDFYILFTNDWEQATFDILEFSLIVRPRGHKQKK